MRKYSEQEGGIPSFPVVLLAEVVRQEPVVAMFRRGRGVVLTREQFEFVARHLVPSLPGSRILLPIVIPSSTDDNEGAWQN